MRRNGPEICFHAYVCHFAFAGFGRIVGDFVDSGLEKGASERLLPASRLVDPNAYLQIVVMSLPLDGLG